jgi:leucyl aminopeptidase
LRKFRFTGAVGDVVVASGSQVENSVVIICVGIGSLAGDMSERIEWYRRAMGHAVRAAEKFKAASLYDRLPDPDLFAGDAYRMGRETVTTLDMAAYHFEPFITDEKRKHRSDYSVILGASERWHDMLTVGAEHGVRVGFAVNQARRWCDMPACAMTPTNMADQADRIARSHGLTAHIFNEQQIIAMGLGGLRAVSQGSAEECRFVVLEYASRVPNAPTVAIVGKGVTFDSGGLSIKPSARMDEMKDDMAGAAAVLSTMELLAHLAPRVNVIGVTPLTENLPSGTAVKPGDVVTFYNGAPAEIKNTDAEGRLILADALSYVVKNYSVDAIIDLATLTGSCAAALGPFYAGLMTKHDSLAGRLIAAGTHSGDRLWRLPFHDDYKAAVRSHVADLCNEGNATYRAGAITAGFFLQRFAGNIPWVHLDIAGTSFNVPDMSYFRPGATGFGVRLLAELIMGW